eukprot:gene8641-16846_t
MRHGGVVVSRAPDTPSDTPPQVSAWEVIAPSAVQLVWGLRQYADTSTGGVWRRKRTHRVLAAY